MVVKRSKPRCSSSITHDIAVARALGGDVAVMLGGRIVEDGAAHAVLATPRHKYTRALIAADPAAWPTRPRGQTGREVIAAAGLSKRFGSRELFRGLDLALRAGERIAVTGPSGSGKSTLGNVLLGLLSSDEGGVRRQSDIDPVRDQKIYQEPSAAFAPGRIL
ncbi:ATP-binding cassette domain-containing protein [Cupriavidus oxalaticus]|uniref:ATP-binding cassette domain-containing protein n=1 Tax=Cupriavidus oxalaticus TaxID=96344 RepID=UPI00316EA6D3